jgi:hypothetical protein
LAIFALLPGAAVPLDARHSRSAAGVLRPNARPCEALDFGAEPFIPDELLCHGDRGEDELPRGRHGLILAVALAVLPAATPSAAEPPKIGRPRPAPATPPDVPPLPPAV